MNILTNQIRECRQENDIIETDLIRWQNEFKELNEQLINPQNLIIRYDSTPLVNKIQVDISLSTTPKTDEQIILSTLNSSNEGNHSL